MAEALILDSEAVNALIYAADRGALGVRARAILAIAYERGASVRIPAPVLGEISRTPQRDAALNQFLNRGGVGVADLTRSIAQRAGHLLARCRLSSAHAVDAFVVATAVQFEAAVIATGDPEDLKRLASPHRHIRIFPI